MDATDAIVTLNHAWCLVRESAGRPKAFPEQLPQAIQEALSIIDGAARQVRQQARK